MLRGLGFRSLEFRVCLGLGFRVSSNSFVGSPSLSSSSSGSLPKDGILYWYT